MIEVLTDALWNVLNWRMFVVMTISAVYGIFVGAVPGLTATMAVALMLPLMVFLSDVQAVAAIVTAVTCSIFAGDIPATLIRIPGTPASAAYANDCYQLTLLGRHRRVLTICVVFSVTGGLFGVFVLILLAPILADFAVSFTSFEYFWLFVMGLTSGMTVSSQSTIRSCFALTFGMLLSTVGLGTDYSVPRLTFGLDDLVDGINFIPAMIGLFGVSEVLRGAMHLDECAIPTVPIREGTTDDSHRLIDIFRLAWRRKYHLLGSSSIGAFIGMLPGAGADIAAWISYAVSKRFSRQPELFGHGSEEGICDATGANNAALGGAWIPALVFGIPGDSVTAIAIGVLMMKNITPSPDIFNAQTNPKQATLVYGLYISFVIANLILLPVGLLANRMGGLLIRIPRRILLPLILLFCIVGAFSMNASYFDVIVMLMAGLLGFVFDGYGIPLGPVVLGIILGGEVEHRFIQCITKTNSPLDFVSSPVSQVLCLMCLAMWLGSMRRKIV